MNDEQYQQFEHLLNPEYESVLGQVFEQEFEQEFEHLPFGAATGQEFERGIIGRQSMASVRRSRLQPRQTQGPRPGQRSWQSWHPWPRPVSRPVLRPTPQFGWAWPYGHVVLEPFEPPLAEPSPAEPSPAGSFAVEPFSAAEPVSASAFASLSEPFSEPGWHGEPDPGAEGETPAPLQDTLARMPAGQRPAYLALGQIVNAISDARSAGPGLYLIEFFSNGQRRAYSGQSDNVRTRLQQHLLCARMLGLSLTGHRVSIAPLPTLAKDQRRALEKAIHTDMLARHRGVLTNQRRELELGLLGTGWA